MRRTWWLAVAAVLASAGCGSEDRAAPGSPGSAGPSSGPVTASPPSPSATVDPLPVDPRDDGFDVGFGEWAVTLEAEAIRPGAVHFVVRNNGTMLHGFEIEREGEDSDNSGKGSGGDDEFKYEAPGFDPQETVAFTLELTAGTYRIECFVDNHDALGMVAFLDVREDAPLVTPEPAAAGTVTIEGFAFQPPIAEVTVGTEVGWANADPTEHTVTARDGAFDSEPFAQGAIFAFTFDAAGEYAYYCKIHPAMEGTVRVGS